MKLLIIGAKGMLGQALAEAFKDKNPILMERKNLDITNENEVKTKLDELGPTVIINAAAYTQVDDCEKNRELAYLVNGLAVGYLAKAARGVGALLIHYSTDYVFDGQKKEGYREEDKPNPISVYGESKTLGENELSKNTDNYYLIRTSWLFGKGGKNFVDTMIDLTSVNKEIKVVDDQMAKPTYTVDLAKSTKELLETKLPGGIYHLTNEGACSWYQFAQKIFEIKKIKVKLFPVTTQEVPRPAKRPEYSLLINTKLKKTRHWEEALRDYLIKD